MAYPDIDTAMDWRGRTVRDPDGEKVGTLGDVFLDRETEVPAWGGVRTGLFGRKESFVPLDALSEEGDELRISLAKDLIHDAPQVDPDVALTASEEERLYRHYEREYAPPGEDDRGAVAEREPGPNGDPEEGMTRSEEEVRVSQGPMRPAERVRLKKVLVTEHQKRTIPVQREVVELEQDPPPGAERDDR